MQASAITRAAAGGDIDWDLLLLLARTEAALTWPDEVPPDEALSDAPAPQIPWGLDLHHPGDLDWVSRVVTLG